MIRPYSWAKKNGVPWGGGGVETFDELDRGPGNGKKDLKVTLVSIGDKMTSTMSQAGRAMSSGLSQLLVREAVTTGTPAGCGGMRGRVLFLRTINLKACYPYISVAYLSRTNTLPLPCCVTRRQRVRSSIRDGVASLSRYLIDFPPLLFKNSKCPVASRHDQDGVQVVSEVSRLKNTCQLP